MAVGVQCSKNPIVVHENYFSWLLSHILVCHECIHNHRAHFFKKTVSSCYSKLFVAQLRAFNRKKMKCWTVHFLCQNWRTVCEVKGSIFREQPCGVLRYILKVWSMLRSWRLGLGDCCVKWGDLKCKGKQTKFVVEAVRLLFFGTQ